MKRCLPALFLAGSIAIAFAADELPSSDESEPMEIEPPLLIQNLKPDGSLPNALGSVDVAKLETDLARARRNAGSGDRLYKAGIISKVEAEDRVLRVARLEAKLTDAQLQAAKAKLEELKSASSADENFTRELQSAEAAVAEATKTAEHAAEARRVAETEYAARNVERQRKLLALGSGRKADVNRAQEKLTELQQPSQ